MEEVIVTDVEMTDIEVPVDSNLIAVDDMVYEEPQAGMMKEPYYEDTNFMNESSGISSKVILVIVIIVCAIAGIGLGFLSGKRSANK